MPWTRSGSAGGATTPEIIVFLGPSLDHRVAEAILPACYRPPAKRGDITRAGEDGARIVVLIDGVFFQDCAVGHREILALLKAGTRVIGASSMGALRAAEMDTLGMEGVGEIYRSYRDGILVSDDEVALIYDPECYTPLSEPLVNIRATLDRAVGEGVIPEETAVVLCNYARGLYFPQRTYESVCDAARGSVDAGLLSRFLAFVRVGSVDLKASDARAALERCRDLATELGITI